MVRNGCQPYRSVPAASAVPVSSTSATAHENSDTSSLLPSSRARGTGTASRYRSEPQLASLATVSPWKSATTTMSRKLDETSRTPIGTAHLAISLSLNSIG